MIRIYLYSSFFLSLLFFALSYKLSNVYVFSLAILFASITIFIHEAFYISIEEKQIEKNIFILSFILLMTFSIYLFYKAFLMN